MRKIQKPTQTESDAGAPPPERPGATDAPATGKPERRGKPARKKPRPGDTPSELARKAALATEMQAAIDAVQQVINGIQRWPSVSELAHLAAGLRRSGARTDSKALAAEAWEVWTASRSQLYSELERRKVALEGQLCFGLAAVWMPAITPRVQFHKRKAEFEVMLKGLVGERRRVADRYAILRKFLAHRVKQKTGLKDEAEIKAKVDTQIAEMKRNGVRQSDYYGMQKKFDAWREEWRSVRAQKAAEERWGDDDEKSAPGA